MEEPYSIQCNENSLTLIYDILKYLLKFVLFYYIIIVGE